MGPNFFLRVYDAEGEKKKKRRTSTTNLCPIEFNLKIYYSILT
jgi:hypothetical protein